MSAEVEELEQLTNQDYKYGFVSKFDSDKIPKGLSEDIIRLISSKKDRLPTLKS